MASRQNKQIGENDHKTLAVWAADCAEHVLAYFETANPDDDRPRKAIDAARAWARGELPMVDARKAAFASHAAAREVINLSAQFAARAAGHAAATAHVADHARHAGDYAIKSVASADDNDDAKNAEINWQSQQLPKRLHAIVKRKS